jgi:hypothetical protein
MLGTKEATRHKRLGARLWVFDSREPLCAACHQHLICRDPPVGLVWGYSQQMLGASNLELRPEVLRHFDRQVAHAMGQAALPSPARKANLDRQHQAAENHRLIPEYVTRDSASVDTGVFTLSSIDRTQISAVRWRHSDVAQGPPSGGPELISAATRSRRNDAAYQSGRVGHEA